MFHNKSSQKFYFVFTNSNHSQIKITSNSVTSHKNCLSFHQLIYGNGTKKKFSKLMGGWKLVTFLKNFYPGKDACTNLIDLFISKIIYVDNLKKFLQSSLESNGFPTAISGWHLSSSKGHHLKSCFSS